MVSNASPGDMVAIIDPDLSIRSLDARAFACPGLHRIVPAKDGGICRVRIALGALSAEQLRAVGTAASQHGNGIVELTNRANLQIRGMPVTQEPFLVSGLVDAGLAPAERWADDARNVMVNPTAGFDPSDLIDVRPMARDILAWLSGDKIHAALSPKFAIQLDGGGDCSVGDHPHDIWLRAIEIEGLGPVFQIGLGGAMMLGTVSDAHRFCAPHDAGEVVSALVAEFIDFGIHECGVARMRDLVRLIGNGEIWRRSELRLGRPLSKYPAERVRKDAIAVTRAPIGPVIQRNARYRAIGAAPPLGRLDPSALASLAAIADEYGIGEIRLTPWRSIFIPDVAPSNCDAAMQALAAAGFATSYDHPFAAMIACSGTTGCASALSDVLRDAKALAQSLSPRGAAVHLSGCAKSCAVPGAADYTLVAVADGRYDLYRRAPEADARFGTLIASRVDLPAARRVLTEQSR
jgi:precorrin-3B synthase